MSGDDFADVDTALKVPSTRPSLPQRAYSTAETPIKASSSQLAPSPHPLSILSLDLKLGHPTAPTASLPALLPSLSLATLSQLLSRRLTSSLTHLTALRARVIDTSSRILVTGDLNAGKSTLVNALLRRDVMPSDQQPCTTVFCEVLDAESHNGGREEIHAIKDVEAYDATNRATYESFELEEVNSVQDDEAGRGYQLLKAYVTDTRAPSVVLPPVATPTDTSNPSFIKNGLVSISLIDAPGLNRDTLSTTALFARQAEIDVIVFVVSAENHFTLSAKEFLWNASREKAYVFIVVNKWKGIKDKDRCMRVVGEQIKQLSPATWDNRSELVHFVDAAEVLDEEDDNPSFDHLEQSLRSFVLLKRAKSKLTPAKHYLLNLLSDLSALSDSNVVAANVELQEALRQLELIKPVHERLVAQRDEVEDGVDKVEEAAVELVRSSAWTRLESALGYAAQGQVAPQDADRIAFAGVESMEFPTQLPAYPGLLGVWSWAEEVKQTLVKSLEASVRAAEDDARIETVDGVKNVLTGLGDKYLPGTMVDGFEQHERVFRPEVMFAKRRRGVGKLAARGISTGLGLGSANVGASWTASEFEVTFIDLFNLERIYPSVDPTKAKKAIREDEGGELAVVSVVSVGVASLGMFGSRVVGIKGAVEAISNVFELLGSQAARRWAGPVVGVFCTFLASCSWAVLTIHDEQRSDWQFSSSSISLARFLSTSVASSPSPSPPPSLPSPPSPRLRSRRPLSQPPTRTESRAKPAKSSDSPAGISESDSEPPSRRARSSEGRWKEGSEKMSKRFDGWTNSLSGFEWRRRGSTVSLSRLSFTTSRLVVLLGYLFFVFSLAPR